jgi:hypothetical protein
MKIACTSCGKEKRYTYRKSSAPYVCLECIHLKAHFGEKEPAPSIIKPTGILTNCAECRIEFYSQDDEHICPDCLRLVPKTPSKCDCCRIAPNMEGSRFCARCTARVPHKCISCGLEFLRHLDGSLHCVRCDALHAHNLSKVSV